VGTSVAEEHTVSMKMEAIFSSETPAVYIPLVHMFGHLYLCASSSLAMYIPFVHVFGHLYVCVCACAHNPH